MASAAQEGESMGKVYTVYNNNTDELLVLDGTREECAKAMGIKVETFHTVLWHFKHGYKTKWAVIEDVEELSPNATFGERVKHHRIKKCMTIKKLGEKSGVSHNSIHRYENGADPQLSAAIRIAEALGLSLEYLAKGG